MIDKHQEADLLRSLSAAYDQIVEDTKKLKPRGPRKGELWAGGKQGGAGGGGKKALGKGDSVGQAEGGKAHNNAGGGKFANNAPWKGAGAEKKEKNNPKADDRRAKRQADQAKADRNASRGITPAERKARAAKNKENKAKAGIDDILKDIRGK